MGAVAASDPSASGRPNIDIKMGRRARAAAGVAGFFGAVAGLGLGAVGGAVAGVVSGLASSVRLGRAYMTEEVPAGESVRARVAAARAAWAAGGGSGGGDGGTQCRRTVGAPAETAAALIDGGGALRVTAEWRQTVPPALLAARAAPPPPRLRVEPFSMPGIVPDTSLVVDGTFVERFARTVAPPDREFARRLARVCGEWAKAQRAELNIPEPESSTAAEGGGGGHADATCDDDYRAREEKLRAASVKVTSVRGLLKQAGLEASKEMEAARSEMGALTLMLLGARFEGMSRGVVPSKAWCERRVAGLLGKADEGAGAVVDPERGWAPDEAAAMREAAAAAAALEAKLESVPWLAVDAAVVPQPGASVAWRGPAEPAWYRIGAVPLAAAAPLPGGAAGCRIAVPVARLPRELAGEAPPPPPRASAAAASAAAGAAAAPGAGTATLRVRCYEAGWPTAPGPLPAVPGALECTLVLARDDLARLCGTAAAAAGGVAPVPT